MRRLVLVRLGEGGRPLAESLGMSATEIKQYAGAFELAESDKAHRLGGIE